MKNKINSVQNSLNSCVSIEKVVYENGLIGTRLAEYSEQKKIVNCERAKTPKRKKVNLNAKILITID